MNKYLLASALLLASTSSFSAQHSQWNYSGKQGPQNWATLTTDYSTCAGKNQSPINISGSIEADLTPIQFNYKTAGNEVINNGHTVQINYAEGSSIKVDGQAFKLLQSHFHAPSENHINGKSYPLEGHFVHADKDGNLAVVAVMFEQGKANSGLAKAWKKMPAHAGEKHAPASAIDANELLPENRDYYRFNGSLTTPPCSEGVRWLVMKQPMAASAEQIKQFSTTMKHPNNRPVQALNARSILK